MSHLRGVKYKPVEGILWANKRKYCDACGYRCILTHSTLSDRPPAWDKIVAVQQAFQQGCKIVAWIDADCMVLRSFSLPDMNTSMVMTGDRNGLNTGVALFRSSPTVDRLLSLSWQQEQFTNHTWWEQAAIRHVFALNADLRADVVLLDGLVQYPQQHRGSTASDPPLYHPAGCFSSRQKTFGVCWKVLKTALQRFIVEKPCPPLTSSSRATAMSDVRLHPTPEKPPTRHLNSGNA